MKHLIFSSKLFAILFVISSMMYIGCQKEESKSGEIKSNLSSEVDFRYSQLNSDFPVLSDDVLKFKDLDHFKNFYGSVDLALKVEDNDLASIFSQIEIGENFVSVSSRLKNDIFPDFKHAYSPFLTDPIMMEICNLNYEFQIGDQLITYINNRQILISDINDFKTRSKIRLMKKGERITANDIPIGAYWGEDTEITEFRSMPCSCTISIEQFGCNQVRVFGKCRDLVWGSGDGSLSIFLNFSTNLPITPSPTFSYRVNGNFEYILNVSTAMNIRVMIDPDCITGSTKTIDFNFTPSAASCDNRERDSGWASVIDGAEAMRYRVQFYSNFWSDYETADNESVQWYAVDQRWESRKANKLETTISASRRGPTSCAIFATETEFKSCNNCGNRNASVNTGVFGGFTKGKHCDGDVVGTFKKINGFTTLNATATLDFDCCL